ncbi:MAG: hypothetical protein AAF772_16360, partial [Acidobacteriota bacterium]
LDLARYRSFTLAAIAPAAAQGAAPIVRLRSWNGAQRDAPTPARPLVSSSFDRFGVGRARRAAWQLWRDAPAPHARDGEPSADAMLAYHRGLVPADLPQGGGDAGGGDDTAGGNAVDLATLRPDRALDAYSVCMDRPDARTVSLTRVRVDADAIALDYADGPPADTALLAAVRLPRAVP